MCCEHEGHHGSWHRGRQHHGDSCDCGCHQGRHHGGFWPFGFGRRFWSKEEIAAWLEQYLEDLRAEAKAVEERIAELKKEE
jgi:hypothetical protein